MIMLEGLPPQWVIGIFGFLIGAGLASIITYLLSTRGNRNRHLELELEQLKDNFQDYRDQVTHHFMRTSELVQEMTSSYRSVYEHLASGAQQLCGDAGNPALHHQREPQLAAEDFAQPMDEDDINYDEYAELSRIRNDIEELLGEGPQAAASERPQATEDSPTSRQH